MHTYRSLLFAPGNHSRRVEKALSLNADVVILDLEDAVAITEKTASRTAVIEALKASRTGLGYVRVNAWDTSFCYGDICAIVGSWIDGIILPKVESAAQLQAIDWLLIQLERERNLPIGSIDLIPLIETGLGHANAQAIASSGARCRRLSFGGVDYTVDMSLRGSPSDDQLDHIRQSLVLASRVAGLEPPIDTVFTHIKDTEGFKCSAERGRALGFQGKLCIHPDQITPANKFFTPTKDEVANAEKIVAAFQQAEKQGLASIQVDGHFVDYPVVSQAQRTLSLMDKIQEKSR